MSSHDSDENEKLEAWLQEQVKKLQALRAQEQRLNAKTMKLRLDFVDIARDKGLILLAVRERLKGMPSEFKKWVENNDIGYSTALLWMDVAQNYVKVKAQFADSNTLELTTLRQIRDAIRDKRQAEGNGKPGSGRRKTATVPKEQNGSVACQLRVGWELSKFEPDFNPEQQSEEDFKAACLCFEHAKSADSTFATVAHATGIDEEEVQRLLRGLDIDKVDAECRRQAGDDLTAAQTQAAERREAKNGSTVAHAQQTDSKTDDAQPGKRTDLHHGCKDFKIEDDRTLCLTNRHGDQVYIVSEAKGIDKLLAKAVSTYTGKEAKK